MAGFEFVRVLQVPLSLPSQGLPLRFLVPLKGGRLFQGLTPADQRVVGVVAVHQATHQTLLLLGAPVDAGERCRFATTACSRHRHFFDQLRERGGGQFLTRIRHNRPCHDGLFSLPIVCRQGHLDACVTLGVFAPQQEIDTVIGMQLLGQFSDHAVIDVRVVSQRSPSLLDGRPVHDTLRIDTMELQLDAASKHIGAMTPETHLG